MGRLALQYGGSVAAIGASVGFSKFQLKRGFVSDRFRSFEIDRPAGVNVVPFELEVRLFPVPSSRLRPIVLAAAGRAWTQIDYPVDQWGRWIWRGTARLAGGVELGRDRVAASLLGGWQYLGDFHFPQHHRDHDISGWSVSLGVTVRVQPGSWAPRQARPPRLTSGHNSSRACWYSRNRPIGS
jgi:hypothetical protein